MNQRNRIKYMLSPTTHFRLTAEIEDESEGMEKIFYMNYNQESRADYTYTTQNRISVENGQNKEDHYIMIKESIQ